MGQENVENKKKLSANQRRFFIFFFHGKLMKNATFWCVFHVSTMSKTQVIAKKVTGFFLQNRKE